MAKEDQQDSQHQDNQNQKKPGFFKRRAEAIQDNAERSVGLYAIRDGMSFIKESISILNPFRKRENVRVETFEESYIRHQQTEEGVQRIYKVMALKFYAAIFMIGLVWLKMIHAAMLGQVLIVFSALAISAVPGAIALTTAFRMHQVYMRQWCSWQDWFGNSDGWWPQSLSQMQKKHRKLEKERKRMFGR
jgi:hypothetical protein